ncbi:hypothetical protein PIB30_020562 [Stylosanthes scabra]|uniref:Disease resistance RPP13-like protein 1 n=1 Tax=Stylosanthes scabra TaxID=79078 RepID=A0ABU6Q9N5_9FABA|nr:hypothetical protein [Stylosanthes scabra]
MATKLDGGAYLSSFVDAILDNLSSMLEDDSILHGNHSALELLPRLESSLYDVRPVLDDAENKQFTDKRVKNWLTDLQDALYFADDLLDELSTKTATAIARDPGMSSYCSSVVDSYVESSGDKENIVQRLESVVARKKYFRLRESVEVDMLSWRTPSTSLVVSSDIFGRDKDKEEIIKLLLADTCHAESPFTVIPIWGMGGIGKTTLAQLVYSDPKVVENFDIRVWVCVAENSDPVHVTRTIIGAIDSCPFCIDNFDVLQTNLKYKLMGKTFLVVLDDVWHGGRDTWENLLKPFQYGNNGSKILLTTRSEKVGSMFLAASQHYRLGLLSDKDCWSLFVKHSSISTNLEQYATLEQIGRKIVDKCKGLPLAVKTLGGLLRNKFDIEVWEKILESEIWELPQDENEIVPALRNLATNAWSTAKLAICLLIGIKSQDSQRPAMEQYCKIRSLSDSIGELLHLRYLNFSETPIVTLPESLCKLYNLQTLKLRDCNSLEMLPSRMQDLVNLRHLDIRGTHHLKEMPKGMSKLKHLNLLGCYVVGEHEENGIRELGPIDVHGSFYIFKLENVNSSSEALEAKMGNKKHINILLLAWRSDGDTVDVETERDILKELRPHQNLKELSIERYRGEIFPDWLGLSCYSNITKLKMFGCKNCRQLPSLGQLPSLQHLEIAALHGLERIGEEFYKSCESCHVGTPFRSLEYLNFCHMKGWREWHTPDKLDAFPKLKTLSMHYCPVLSGDLPARLPALKQLEINLCEELAYSLLKAPKLHTITVNGWLDSLTRAAPHEVRIDHTKQVQSVLELLRHVQPPCLQRLKIDSCWSAITLSGDYLPPSLQYLVIKNCSELTFPEPLEHQLLTEIHLYNCDSVTSLPLGALPNLKKLATPNSRIVLERNASHRA